MGSNLGEIRQRLQRLESRPACIALGFLAAGIFTSTYFGASDLMWPRASLVCALIIGLVALRNGSFVLLKVALVPIFFFLGIQTASTHLTTGADFILPAGKIPIQATVQSMTRSGPDFRVFIVGSAISTNAETRLPGNGALLLRNSELDLMYGDRIAFRAYIRKPRNRGNPGEFDWEIHCLNKGIIWQASVRGRDSVLLIRRGSRLSPSAMLFSLRVRMAGFLDGHAEAGVRGILKGIVLGDRGELAPGMRRNFADSGLVHLLSASGLHVAVVAFFTFVLVRVATWLKPGIFLRLPLKKIAASASLITMVLYCLLVGARAPTVRATIMGMVFVSAVLLDRRSLSANSLALAGIIMLLYEPLSLLTPGFQLSFCAVAGIVAVVPAVMEKWWEKKKRVMRSASDQGIRPHGAHRAGFSTHFVTYGIGLFWTSLAAQIAVAPVLLMTFHSLPVYSLAANLIAAPIFVFALPSAIAATLVGSIAPQIGTLMLIPAEYSIRAIIWVSQTFSALPLSTLRISEMRLPEFLLVSLSAGLLLYYFRNPNRRSLAAVSASAGAVLIVIAVPWLLNSRAPMLKVAYLNVGRADAAVLSTTDGGNVLVDAGSRTPYFDAGRSIVVPYLRYRNIRTLAGAIISHPQMDHMGGLLEVMDRTPPARIWWNPVDARSEFLEKILRRADSERIPVYRADRNCRPIRLGKARLHFVNPRGSGKACEETGRCVNDASVVCRLEFGSVSFLFCGDIGSDAEKELLASGLNIQADVLKVGHHGSATSSSRAFINSVRPRLAIISCNYPNYGSFPSPVVLERLRSSGARVLWTGRDGAVTVKTDGKTIWYETGRGISGSIHLQKQE